MTLIQTGPATAGSPPATAADRIGDRLPGAAVEFDGVSRRFGEVLALDDLRLRLQIGETVALLGPNGAGKSTAIGLMLGLLEPTSGSISRPRHVAARCGRQRPVGSMLQQTGLPSNVRVGELVEFARRLYPHPLSQAAVLERAGLTALSDRRSIVCPAARASACGSPSASRATRTSSSSTSRPWRWTSRPGGPSGRTCAARATEGRTDPVRHPLPRGGRPGRRPDRRPRPRADRRGRHGSVHPGQDRCPDGPVRPGPGRRGHAREAPRRHGGRRSGRRRPARLGRRRRTVREIFRADLPIHDLEVTGADLEDAFIALTSTLDRPPGGHPMTAVTDTTRRIPRPETFPAFAAFVRLEVRRALRNRRYVMFAVAFPVVFYLLYTGVLSGTSADATALSAASVAGLLHGLDGDLWRDDRRGAGRRHRDRPGARWRLDAPAAGDAAARRPPTSPASSSWRIS